MTTEFTQNELAELQGIENSLRAATAVALRNKQNAEILSAKVDTIGVTTVSHIKDLNKAFEAEKKAYARLDEIVGNQDFILTVVESNKDSLSLIGQALSTVQTDSKTVVEATGKIEESYKASLEKIDQDFKSTSNTYEHHVQSFNERTEEVKGLLMKLDYSQELVNLSETITELKDNISNIGQQNDDNYTSLSKKIEMLKVAVSTTMQTAKDYQKDLDKLADEVQTFDKHLDTIGANVAKLQIKPSLVAQDAIMEMFASWSEPKDDVVENVNETVEETSEETDLVTEDISVDTEVEAVEDTVEHTEPVVETKPKKGFFGFFK